MHIRSEYFKKYAKLISASISSRDASSLNNTLPKARDKHNLQPLANKGPAPNDMNRSFALNKANYKMGHLIDKRIKPYTS